MQSRIIASAIRDVLFDFFADSGFIALKTVLDLLAIISTKKTNPKIISNKMLI